MFSGLSAYGLLACLVLGTAFWSARASAADEPCAPPAATSDGWEVATPEAAGFDAGALCAALTAVARADANLHGVIVERHGRLVAELYRAGRAWRRGVPIHRVQPEGK